MSGHISLRPDGGPESPNLPSPAAGRGAGGAVGLWCGLLAVYLLIAWLGPEPVREAMLPERPLDLVWLPQPGPGGGGGGGNQRPEPPKPAEVPGRQQVSVPAPPQLPEPTPAPVEAPLAALELPALPMAAATTLSVGVLEAGQASASTGSGPGTGAGPGQGSGLGPGTGGGAGGGVFRPGSGVESARLLRRVPPQYTADAVRAKVQGVVQLECVVLPTGAVGECDVQRSFDPAFGLDQEAIKAARQWRFLPGTRFGEPVATFVTLELTFTLR